MEAIKYYHHGRSEANAYGGVRNGRERLVITKTTLFDIFERSALRSKDQDSSFSY